MNKDNVLITKAVKTYIKLVTCGNLKAARILKDAIVVAEGHDQK